MIAEQTDQAHVVYRCYDAADRLLYVGHTNDVVSRLGIHRSSWNNPASSALSLRMVRHTTTEYPSKATAQAAERRAIFDEAPLFNLHHQRVRRTYAQRRADIEAYIQATQPRYPGLMATLAAMFTPPTADTTQAPQIAASALEAFWAGLDDA